MSNSILQQETRKTLPLDFGLYNEQHLNTLYITDDAKGQSFRLELTNSAGELLDLLAPQDGHPPYHFELVFRPGVLNEALLPHLQVEETDVEFTQVKNDDGTFSLRFKLSPQTLEKGMVKIITLLHVVPDGRLGSRGTRVLLRYHNLRIHGADVVISGFRETHLNIVTHLGKPDIPLHIDMVGAAQVLNNGVVNDPLILRVSNISIEDTIQPSPNSLKPSRLFISFDAGDANEEWALGTAEQVKAIQVRYRQNEEWVDADREDGDEGVNAVWSLPLPALGPRDFFDIQLNNIVTNHPAGHTKVYLRHINIPNYWDDHYVARLEKSPMICRGSQIGMGVKPVMGTLNVFNAEQFPIATISTSDIGTWFRMRNTSAGGRAWNIISTGAANGEGAGNLLFKQDDGGPIRLMLDAHGRVGIDTFQATDRLQVGDFGNSADTYISVKTTGGNQFKAGIKLRHFSEGDGFTLVSDETKAAFQIIGDEGGKAGVPALHIQKNNYFIGIGTTIPEAKLQIIHQNQDANGNTLVLGPTGQSNLRLGYHGDYSWIQSHGSKPLAINPLGNNVGIGTTSAAAALHVSGGVNGVELLLEADTDNSGGDSPTLTMRTNGGRTVGQFGFMDRNRNLLMRNQVSNTTFTVQHDGNIVAYRGSSPIWATNTSVSDINLKTAVEPIPDALQRLTALSGISFRWKDDCYGTRRELGLIAQEVEALFPELMQPLDQGARLVQYDKFVPVLVEALKEQQRMIEELRDRLEERP